MNRRGQSEDDLQASEPRVEPFDLAIHLGPDAIPWVSASSASGAVHGIPRHSAALPPLAELLDHVYDYTDAVRFAERQPKPELTKFLGALVFGDPMVLQLFQATRGVAANRGRQVLFRILAGPHLAVLPWELLPDPAANGGSHPHRYLALAPDIHLIRQARGRSYAANHALLQAPLNLLLVLSSPTPQNEQEEWLAFDTYEVKQSLLAELKPLVDAGMLQIDVEDKPTPGNLRRRIGAQRRGYHLFHYVGHALPDRLILEDRAGRRQDLASNQFVEILRLCPDLRLAVFAGCETARPAGDPATLDTRTAVGWRDLLSLADYCVQEACPAVIGMQAVLPFSTERVFTRYFYQALANGYTIAEAMRLGRGAVHGNEQLGGDLLDWSVPALFVGSTEPGALLPRTSAPHKPLACQRADLKLGVREGSVRFFARELALRQAVEIMAGAAPERVLVITGAEGSGKTSLIHRALEELGEGATHVLYLHFDRLAPAVAQAFARLDAQQLPDLAALNALTPDLALERLCRLVAELLKESGNGAHACHPAWTIEEWWERLVSDVARHRFLIVIDDLGILDRAQQELLELLVRQLLAEHFAGSPGALQDPQQMAQLQEEWSRLVEQQAGQRPALSPQGQAAAILAMMENHLATLSERLQLESRQVVGEVIEAAVIKASYRMAQTSLAAEATFVVAPDALAPAEITATLGQLERVRAALGSALRVLAERRSPARIVITARDMPKRLLTPLSGEVYEMRLAQLTWPEMWRWIRRNLPGLLSYGEEFLSQQWSRLGAYPERWEALERQVLAAGPRRAEISKFVNEIAPVRAAKKTRQRHRVRRSERALRIAVAGPHLQGPDELAEAITRLGIEYRLGGRVVAGMGEVDALASLIDVPSPFTNARPKISPSEILDWLERVIARQPDVILLDYGERWSQARYAEQASDSAVRNLLRSLHYRTLLIGAGGNEGLSSPFVTTPAAFPEVLSVGPLDPNGTLRPYAEWHPDRRKPDLFMTDDLTQTALGMALRPKILDARMEGMAGSSFSALHAVAAATLVWSLLPDYSPRKIRELLVDASRPVADYAPARALTIGDAIALARQQVVERTLVAGPASLETLGAMTGLEPQLLGITLRELEKQGTVAKLVGGRMERYQWLPAGA